MAYFGGKRKIIRMKIKFFLFISLVITILALYFSFRGTDIRVLVGYILGGQYVYIIPALIGLLLYCYLRAVRWALFFEKKISIKILWSATMVGLMANNIFPAKAGEFLKVYILCRRCSVSKSACFATVLLERLWDGIVLLFFLAVIFLSMLLGEGAYIFNSSSMGSIRYAAYIFCAFYLLIIFIIVLWKFNSKKMINFIQKLFNKFSPVLSVYISDRLKDFNEGFSALHNKRRIVIITLYSLAIWIVAVLVLYSLLKVFSFNLPYTASFILMVIVALFVLIPSLGTLGTMQLAFVFGLGIYAIDKTQALSFSFVYQFFDTVPVVIIGLFYFFKDGLSFNKMRRSNHE